MGDEPLFWVEPKPNGPLIPESYGVRLTRRNKEMLDAGRHPATKLPVRVELGKCGDCAHHHRYAHHDRTYNKCDVHRLGQTHSEASDIRVSWPACEAFAPKEVA